MNLFKLSWKNITTRPLSALLSIILLGLSIMLISLMLHIGKQLEQTLDRNIKGIDMVLGAKGSPLQLILSAVFQIDAPTGNIAMRDANKIARSPLVKMALPLAYGDSYQGYRIVGTELGYLTLYQAELLDGMHFEEAFQVVIGASVARELHLTLGQTFYSQHGFAKEGERHETKPFKVVGILKPNGTVIDKLLLTTLSSIWESHDHGEEEHEGDDEKEHHEGEKGEEHNHETHDKGKEITAMLIKFRSPMGLIQLPHLVNKNTMMQAALPSYEVHRLLGLMEGGVQLLQGLAMLIMLASGFSIFVGLYNAIKERKYEMALLRNFGASRWQLLWLVVQEGLLLTFAGFIVGIAFSRLIFLIFSQLSYATYQFYFESEWLLVEEVYLMLAVLLVGIIASILPAIQVVRLQISKVLAEQ